jgi:antitoxin component of MazEF toxin-antitoxin module
MTIKSIQKVIRVGSSVAVTLPARDAKSAGIIPGSEVEITAKLTQPTTPNEAATIDTDYQAFKAQYGETLKNLADR